MGAALFAGANESNVVVGNREQVLHYGNGTEPEGIDPHIVTGVTENHIISALFEGLVGIDPHTLDPLADAGAERWEVSPDGLTYTFHLRPEATWSNGDPVRASDYVYSYHRMLNPRMAAKYAYMLYPLRHAEAYNTTQLGRLLVGLVGDFPQPWEELKQVDFAAHPEHALEFNRIGLDRLTVEQFDALEADPTLFEWPADVTIEAREEILARLRAYREGPREDLWERADVGVVAVDDFTLRLELEKPAPYLLGMLNHYSWYPVHPPTIEHFGGMTKRDSLWTRPGNIVVNGPFDLAEWIVNRHIRVVKRPSYWDAEEVRLREIYFYPIDDVEAEQRAFRDGYIHVTSTVPTHRIDFNRRHFPDNLRFDAYLGTYYYRINVTPPGPDDSPRKRAAREALSDKRVRRALALAIDREAIVNFLGAGQLAAYAFVPQDTAGYVSPVFLEHDPEEARALLAAAGYAEGEGFPQVEFLYNTSEGHKQIAEIIQQMWKR
ncbi:MAG: peptide ABC transporter substrate-binding protein, partial [Opitutales bacterium]